MKPASTEEDDWQGIVSPADYSDCIGAIYDCTIDPGLWPAALERIAALVYGVCGVVVLAEPEARVTRFHRSWNLGEEAARLFYAEYAASNPLTPLFGRFGVDEPYNISAVLDPADWEATPIFREFGEPLGFRDCVGVTLLKTPLRFASLWIATPTSADYTGTRELQAMALVAPHVRRALAIGDLIEMRTLAAGDMETALNALAPAVVLLDRQGRLVFANDAARDGETLRFPLASAGGRIELADRIANTALRRTLDETGEGPSTALTLGVRRGDGEVSFVHVLPIEQRSARGRAVPSAAVALFVTPAASPNVLSRDAWSGAFGLTAAEAGILERLVAGLEPGEIARQSGIGLPTVRSHLARIFHKTGTSRQADLVRLAASLEAPVAR